MKFSELLDAWDHHQELTAKLDTLGLAGPEHAGSCRCTVMPLVMIKNRLRRILAVWKDAGNLPVLHKGKVLRWNSPPRTWSSWYQFSDRIEIPMEDVLASEIHDLSAPFSDPD